MLLPRLPGSIRNTSAERTAHVSWIQPRCRRFQLSHPRLEALEDRTLPAILHVTNLLDAGTGSLRDNVALAGASDVVQIDVTGIIQLTTGAIAVNNAATIKGPGVALLALDGQKLNGDCLFQ